jgi:hypothetical protein
VFCASLPPPFGESNEFNCLIAIPKDLFWRDGDSDPSSLLGLSGLFSANSQSFGQFDRVTSEKADEC